MTEVDERIARIERLLDTSAGEPDHDVLAHTLNMLRQLRAEETLDGTPH
jgi:hypothetical protein